MARHTITEAIKLADISRTQMYNHYIKKGLLKVSEASGKKYIDTSDLIAVFGELKAPNTPVQNDTEKDSIEHSESTLVKELRERIAELKADKNEMREENAKREERHQTTIIALTSRLEAPKQKGTNPLARWWHGLGDNKSE